MAVELVVDPTSLLRAHQALTDLEARNFIAPELEVYGRTVVEVGSPYPPQGQYANYERTGHLLEGWSRSVNGLDVEIKNDAEYAGWVLARNPRHKIGTKRKMRMGWKIGNWKETYKVMLEEMDKWIVEMEHKAFRLWER